MGLSEGWLKRSLERAQKSVGERPQELRPRRAQSGSSRFQAEKASVQRAKRAV